MEWSNFEGSGLVKRKSSTKQNAIYKLKRVKFACEEIKKKEKDICFGFSEFSSCADIKCLAILLSA